MATATVGDDLSGDNTTRSPFSNCRRSTGSASLGTLARAGMGANVTCWPNGSVLGAETATCRRKRTQMGLVSAAAGAQSAQAGDEYLEDEGFGPGPAAAQVDVGVGQQGDG